MSQCRRYDKRGTTIIDGLRLCFIAESSLLEDLSQIQPRDSIDMGRYILTRVGCKSSRYAFSILHNVNGQTLEFGKLKFGLTRDDLNPNYVWLWVENRVLYEEIELRRLYNFVATLNLKFNNFTLLDIAIDVKTNVVSLIRKLYKDLENETIFNDKKIQNRKKVIEGMTYLYSTTLYKLVNPTLYFKQREAIHDKTKGVVVIAYNKLAEIVYESDKQYILDYYDRPKTLHRLEVHLNQRQVSNYARLIKKAPSLDWIFDERILTDMYYYHLQSVIRFTTRKNRKPIDWKEILCADNPI